MTLDSYSHQKTRFFKEEASYQGRWVLSKHYFKDCHPPPQFPITFQLQKSFLLGQRKTKIVLGYSSYLDLCPVATFQKQWQWPCRALRTALGELQLRLS